MEINRLPSEFTLPKERDLQDLIDCVKDWALFNGAAMRSKKQYSPDAVEFAPFTLLPSSFPKSEFEKAVDIQIILNELIHNVAHDYEFLKSSLQNTIEVDDFTKRLFDIYETVHKEGLAQSFCLGLLRSDYMVDSKKETLFIKQVEINAIASSLAGLSTQISLQHRFVLERLQRFADIKRLPQNNALSGLCSGLIDAWKLYNNSESIILMIIEDISYNICDQRFHEFEIYKVNPKIKVLRRTLTEISTSGRLNLNKELFVEDKEVAVVYFRSGYSPDQYPTDKEWNVRLMMERSKAIKCPTIHYHLAGTKKVQQALASNNAVAKFLKEPEKIKKVSDIFTGLYSLDLDTAGDEAVQMALKNPNCFVLKPQREGGGNNIYGEEISKVLSKLGNTKERTAYILMNRILPPVHLNYIVRPGNTNAILGEDVVSELGIFGVILGEKDNVIINKQIGHVLRTKEHTANEGGVSAGIGALDSPFLY